MEREREMKQRLRERSSRVHGHRCFMISILQVYFTEEFQHLRELVFPSGEDKQQSGGGLLKFD